MRKTLNLLIILAALPVLALPIAAQAQFQYTIADDQVTITNYTGSGGEVTIPSAINGDPVTAIGANAFQNRGVTTVMIPDSVTNIGSFAFESDALTSVTIPASVTSIGDCPFLGCPLPGIAVSAANPSYTSVGGVLFNKALTTLIEYPAGKTGSSYVIPASVTNIGPSAFYECEGLSSVTIGNGVTSIGEWAFGDIIFLTSVTIGSSLSTIGESAFEYCAALQNITIPDSVTDIGDSAFSYCGLTSVAIPASVTDIGVTPFIGCPLTTISVSAANLSYASVGGVLFNNALTTLIEYPERRAGSGYVIPDGVTNIVTNAFEGCTTVASVTIPNSVTSIGTYAFAGCSSLLQAFFQGNAPSVDGVVGSEDTSVFLLDGTGKAYYVPGTTGWGATFGGWPTAQSYQPQPQILGSAAGLTAGSAGLQFTISWATNTSVVVQASTDLQNWTPVSTNTLVNGTSAFVDSTWANYPQRFYRIVSE